MEAPVGCLATGEQSGGQDRHPPEFRPRTRSESPSPPQRQRQAPHGALRQPKHSRRQHPERKRLRRRRQSGEPGDEAATVTSGFSPEAPPSSAAGPAQEGKQKRERKPQRPGKYVCTYCGRACAKPSVLQKHIRSHTGERPYPCGPCGFSFKTKSNLYKHRKSHTHRVKAGLAAGEPRSLEDQATESEDETRELSSALSDAEKQRSVSLESRERDRGNDDSYAVKKRLALRLSRGKPGPQDSLDGKASALTFGSKGSTESGYFSRSESTEQVQDSPPNTSAKSYAEIILGKYGRLGHLQRMPRQHQQQPLGQEDKGVPFAFPKKQVIDHITKLITINEAVVDTSKIDRVKPRRFSLSRKNSSESPKSLPAKGTSLVQAPKAADVGFKTSGSITMGVPCEKFHHPSPNVEKPADKTPSPLVRSHSMPSSQSPLDPSGCKFRSSQSFDERQPSERPASRRYGMLKRQPAIEIPLGAELEPEGPPPFRPDCRTAMPDPKERRQRPYENPCQGPQPRNQVVTSKTKSSNHPARAGASTIRKRRKEERFESDDPSPPGDFPGRRPDENAPVYGAPRRPAPHTCSVIQHTSSFEKQESISGDHQATEASRSPPPHEEDPPQKQPQPESAKGSRRLVRQQSIRVPEIFVTEDSGLSAGSSVETTSTSKQPERPDGFQWPQRSPSLSQLPIEKLPPKKKRLRLAEAAQSSGESSFDSVSLSRSPSQDSGASYGSSRSTSFEESNRPDMDIAASPPARKSRAPNMLTVPGVHQHKEMRRSASEQAPHDPQPGAVLAETRSKSFDYSCLSPERSAVGWRERRKCLLIRHTAVRDPDEDLPNHRSPERLSPGLPLQMEPPCGPPSGCLTGETLLPGTGRSQIKEVPSQWELGLPTSLSHPRSVEPVQEQAPPQAPPTHGSSGAARARYLPMSTGLKLEIPSPRGDYPEVRACDPGLPQSSPVIASSPELLQPAPSPVVAVRLQTDTLALASPIYTTLSQAPRSQEKVDAILHRTATPTLDYKDLSLDPFDHQRASGSGGNKRMLSPSNSIEIHPETQQQQKRVKEEEGEKEVDHADKASLEVLNQEKNRVRPTGVCPPIPGLSPSFPSLLPGTCNSWCYLNYTKPNPSALDKHKPSVYSSWSTAGYDPNPPGLSSKTALALLSCRQRLGPSIYTTSPMSASTPESLEENGRPRGEVYTSRSYGTDQDAIGKGPGAGAVGERSRTNQPEEEERLVSETRSKQNPGRTEPPTCTCEGHNHPSDGGSPPDPLRVKDSGKEAPPGGTDPGAPERPSGGGDGEQMGKDGGGSELDRSTARRGSASVRRALFARRRLDASSSPGPAPLQKPPTPPRSPSPGPLRSSTPPSPPSSSSGWVSVVQARVLEPSGPPADPSPRAAAAQRLAGEVGPAHIGPALVGPAHVGPPRGRGPDNLLRHLPLHSQQPGRAPSLLIPIGGIHMIQPRSLLPLYTLVGSPSPNPPGPSWRFGDAPKGRPQRQDPLRTAASASPDHGT